jgi:hypothetical protein
MGSPRERPGAGLYADVQVQVKRVGNTRFSHHDTFIQPTKNFCNST